MNVRLSKHFQASAITLFEGDAAPEINHYVLTLDITTNSASSAEQNIAYSRIRYWIHDVFENSLLISADNANLANWQTVHPRCLLFPEDPVDQLVGIMLHSKLTAIAQDRLIIGTLSISSPRDEHVIYHHEDGDSCGPLEISGWWNDAGLGWSAPRPRSRNKVINLARQPEWKDVNLDWDDSTVQNVVLNVDFKKDDSK